MIVAVYKATFYLFMYFQVINNNVLMLSRAYLLLTILPQLFAAGLSRLLCKFLRLGNPDPKMHIWLMIA